MLISRTFSHCECVCCIVSCTSLNKYSPNASRIARPAPTIGWIPVREKRRMGLGLVLGVVVRVPEPSSSWLPVRGYCQRLSLLPPFRLLRGVVERDPMGLNSTLDPEDWLVGLECGCGLAGFDLMGAVSSIPSSASTQDSTSIWYDVTGLVQCCFRWGCCHVGKASYPILYVNFYCISHSLI